MGTDNHRLVDVIPSSTPGHSSCHTHPNLTCSSSFHYKTLQHTRLHYTNPTSSYSYKVLEYPRLDYTNPTSSCNHKALECSRLCRFNCLSNSSFCMALLYHRPRCITRHIRHQYNSHI
jgi:hypothetical protein